ncbi:MAG: CorA family divalent cation transporter [Kiritimatiellia bacterium]
MKIPESWQIPETIRQRLGNKSLGYQQALLEDGHLLMILHRVPSRDDFRRAATIYWRDPRGAWYCSEQGPALQVLREHIATFSAFIDTLEKSYDKASNADEYFDLLELLAPVHRAAKNMHLTLAEAKDGFPTDFEIIDLHDEAYAAERDAELLYTAAKNAMDYHVARQAELQARLAQRALESSHRLNLIASIFMPVTAFSGLFGMNLNSGLDSRSVVDFWLIAIAGITLGVLMQRWVMRKE